MNTFTEPVTLPATSETTPSGLPFVGALRWGDHFSQFYETAEDLRDCLVPYFQAGLENNEKCLWVTSEPFGAAEAAAALRAAVPTLDALIARGQIEILNHEDWYLCQADLAVEDLPRAWLARVDAALAAGYAGLRVTGNVAFLEASGWHDFMHYEATVHRCFKGQRIIALCSYPIGRCRFAQVLDVIRNHGFAIARRDGRWETIESGSLAETKAELARLNRELERRVEERTAGLLAALAERKQAEERLRERERHARELLEARDQELADTKRLQDISTLLIQEGEIEPLYHQILDAAIAMMRSDMASIQMLDQDRGELRLLAWKGFHPASAAFWEWVRVGAGSTCSAALGAGQRVVVPDIEACDFIVGTPDLDAFRQSQIRAVQSTPLVSRSGRLVGMISTHWREPHEPADRELRLFDALARQAADLIERAKAEAALRESEARYRGLTEAIAAVVWRTGPDGQIDDVSQWRALTGQSREEVRGWGWLDAIHPDDRGVTREVWTRAVKMRIPYDTEYRVRMASGAYRWYNARGVPVLRDDGTVREWVGVCIDITGRKQAEEKARLLAREVNHRANNLLTIMGAMMRQTRADTVPAFIAAMQDRIHALARVQTRLARDQWNRTDLLTLIREELAPFGPDISERFRIVGPTVPLAAPAAQALAIVIHELATNAVKHGALSISVGRVAVEWMLTPDRQLVLSWRETGGPRVSIPNRQGFGTRAISILAQQLEGTIDVEWRAEGLVCRLSAPARNLDDLAEPATRLQAGA